MSIDRTYRCDLCNDRHSADAKQLVGIYWQPGNTLVIKSVASVEHHLCRRCIEAVGALRSTQSFWEAVGVESTPA